MRIAICEDEQEIGDMLLEMAKKLYPEAEFALYQSGEALLMSGRQWDIFLLDIRLPGISGMETARKLREKDKRAILIFVTALEEYVFQAFDVEAFHYLVKPFDDDKFSEVLGKAAKRLEDGQREGTQESESLMITAGGKHISVRLEEIVYAEVYDRKVVIHTMDTDIEYYGKMKELEKKAGDGFYRPHRAYLVNFEFIRKYDSTTIYLKKGQALMAKQNYHDFVRCYLRYIQRKGRG